MFNWFRGIFHSITAEPCGEPVDASPTVNIDGTPMMGCLDVHGNPYGVIGSQATLLDTDSTFTTVGMTQSGCMDIPDEQFAFNSDDLSGCAALDTSLHGNGVFDSWTDNNSNGLDDW